MSNQTVSGLIDFHSRKKIYYGSQWDQKLSGYWYSSKYQKIVWLHSKMVKPNCLTLGEW